MDPHKDAVASTNGSGSLQNDVAVPAARPSNPAATQAGHHSGYTRIAVDKCSFIWTVHTFSLYREESGEKLESPTFPPGRDDRVKWRLRLYPRGRDPETKDYLSLYLLLVSSNVAEIRAKYKLCILHADEEKFSKASDGWHTFASGTAWGFPEYVPLDFLRDKANELLPQDDLTIFCEIDVEGDRVTGYSNELPIESPKCTLSADLGSLFDNREFSDVTLSAGDRDLRAHKAILAARSPVFAAMFGHDLEERKQNRVVIEDVDHDVLEEMLTYIYTGRSRNVDAMATELLVAADKYDLSGLKAMCEKALCSALTVENAADILILANRHSAQRLKAHVTRFVNTHVKGVMDSSGWENMIRRLCM